MKMNDIDIWLWEELKKGSNPMFGIAELAQRRMKVYGGSDSHHPLYNTIRRSIAKFEKFGLLHVYRVVNGGTVIMSKERAL